MRKRKYDSLVPDRFKDLVRNALQQPKVAYCNVGESGTASEIEPRQQMSNSVISTSFSCSKAVLNSSSLLVGSFLSDVSTTKTLNLPKIPSISFYSVKDRPATASTDAAADSIITGSCDATARWSITPTKPEYLRLIQLYKKRCSLFAPERRQHCFQMFAKLKEALVYASQQSNCHVFAQEVSSDGCRLFFVCKMDEFISHFKQTKLGHRHFYEVIRHGNACHAYMDIEFSMPINSGLDGGTMTRSIISLFARFMANSYSVAPVQRHILHLDSSTDSKFSRHLVITIPGVVWADNSHAGAAMTAFVLRCCATCGVSLGQEISKDALIALQARHEEAAVLALAEGRDSNNLIVCSCIDLAVYTKNRCFRLPMSSKFGRTATLQVHATNKMPLDQTTLRFEMDLMTKALVSADVSNEHVRILTHDGHCHGRRRLIPSSSNHFVSSSGTTSVDYGRSSPYPLIDAEILRIWNVRAGGKDGTWSNVSIDASSCKIIYQMSKANRWCDCVGREHKSNGIFIVASWSRGVFWQKCWDAECRSSDFKSNEFPIPAIALASSLSGASVDDDEEWNEAFESALAAAERNAGELQGVPEWNEDLEVELQHLENTLLQRDHVVIASANLIVGELDYSDAIEQQLQALENARSIKF